MADYTQATAKASQRADVWQMIVSTKPEKHSIGDVGFRFGKNLSIRQPVVKHDEFQLETQNGLNRRASVAFEVRRDRVPQADKIHLNVCPASPVIIRHEDLKQDKIFVRIQRGLVGIEHRIPFRVSGRVQL